MTFGVINFCAIAIVALTITEQGRLFKYNARADLSALSHNTAEELVKHLAFGTTDELAVTTYLLKFEVYQNIKSTHVYDRHAKLVAQYLNPNYFSSQPQPQPVQQMAPDQKFHLGLFEDNNQLRLVTQIGDENLKLGYLVVVLDFSKQLQDSENIFYAQLLPMILAVLVITFILAHWLQTGLIRPLIELNTLVNKVQDTSDYSLRVETHGDDEISQLGSNLNQMLRTIDQQHLENQAHTKALEQQQKNLEYLANYDQLTKLPNRKLFQELLKQELSRIGRHHTELAVMFIDLDDFKTVNDTLGHHAGDLLLKGVSERIREQLRDCDILARLGGDEFVIVATGLKEEIEAVVIADRILEQFNTIFNIDKWQVSSGLSIGIAFSDGNKIDLQSIISNADLAMYRAKQSGRGRYAIYEDEMQSNQHRRLMIVNQLNNALNHNEFELYYQPKVCPTRGVTSLEALIRWNSKFDGFISPGEFIPIAEHCGKVHEITRWVLVRGFAEAEKLMLNQDIKLGISFNISAHDIAKDGFVDYITALLAVHKIAPSSIEFEVTESSYIENFERANLFFEKIIALGCQIALDDFGTGYSSLSYLTQINAHTLKIDQQFIRKMFDSKRERLIVDAIISLAKNLNLKICAEGVETKQQFDYLADSDCDLIQGYYFEKPVPFNQINTTIERINQQFGFSQHS